MKKEDWLRLVVIWTVCLVVNLPITFALEISEVTVESVNDRAALISWKTDKEADSRLRYGTNKSSLESKTSLALTKEHLVALRELDKNTQYFFKVLSIRKKTNEFDEDDNEGNYYTFATVVEDTQAPVIELELPDYYNDNEIDLKGKTEVDAGLRLYVNEELVGSDIAHDGRINFVNVKLKPAENNTIRIEAKDTSNNTNERSFNVVVDMVAPEIILSKELPSLYNGSDLLVEGKITELASLEILVGEDEVFSEEEVDNFSVTVGLEEGLNKIIIKARDKANSTTIIEREIGSDTLPPEIEELKPIEDRPFYYEGRAVDTVRGKTEPGAKVYMYVSGIFITGKEEGDLSAKEVKDKAQYVATADSEGNFEFEGVDFEHPIPESEDILPRQLSPTLLDVSGRGEISELEQQEREARVFILVVDKVGLEGKFDYYVDIGTCFSGFFDFNVEALPNYQTPTMLSPMRLSSGTEIISFVLSLGYRGGASYNRLNQTTKVDDDYFEIRSVSLEPACREAVLKDDESFKVACQLIKGSAEIERPINKGQTNWYFRYNLAKNEDFNNFSRDYWQDLINNELKFPFKIHVQYTEKLPGEEVKSKAMTICRDVNYFVDIPLDPRDVLSDPLLESGINIANSTINLIDNILPTLEVLIMYAGFACMAGIGLKFVLQIYRRATERWEMLWCQFGGGDEETSCPVKDLGELQRCYYIKEDGEKPFPDGVSGKYGNDDNVVCPFNEKEGGPSSLEDYDMEKLAEKGFFLGTVSAWKTEAQINQFYRFSCDRVFCRDVPAKWTQGEELPAINEQDYMNKGCPVDASNTLRLITIKDCKEQVERVIGTATTVGISDIGQQCFQKGTVLYIKEKEEDGAVGLKPVVDLQTRRAIVGGGGKKIWAYQEGDYLYTAVDKTCEEACGEQWTSACGTIDEVRKNLSIDRMPYRFGPTKDCWKNSMSAGPGSEFEPGNTFCWCWEDDEEEEKVSKGALSAGTEDPGGWKWSYRQSSIYRETGGSAGIYYPEQRYYKGRDYTGAFGQNYAFGLDILGGKRETRVDPFTQHIGAIQSVCLSGIRARLLALRSLMAGLMNCLNQVKLTGSADAGVCKEMMTQMLCSLIYRVFSALSGEQCIPDILNPSGQPLKKEPGLDDLMKVGTGAIRDTTNSMAAEIEEDYGNAKLNQFLSGGEEALMKKVCMAAFGADVGFDFNQFIDAAYSVPFQTMVQVFSSEGAVGRREFLTFDPSSLKSIYEYRAAWLISAGCDLESYTIQLAAVTDKERREFPGIDCSAVDNREPGSNGCDNINGPSERTAYFYNGLDVTQGDYIDENKVSQVESENRYDHLKITLRPKPHWDASKCFSGPHLVGERGVYYFPIRDATAKELLQCNLELPDAIFRCGLGELYPEGVSWIQTMECLNPTSNSYDDCDDVAYSLENKDEIKVRVNIFTTGEENQCLSLYMVTQAGEKVPERTFMYPIFKAGVNNIPYEVELGEVTQDRFKGKGGLTIGSQCQGSEVERENVLMSGTVRFTFDKENSGFKVKVDNDNIKALGSYSFEKENGERVLKNSNGGNTFSLAQLKDVQYEMNGFTFNVHPVEDKSSSCSVTTTPVSYLAGQSEQTWKVYAELYHSNQYGACSENNAKVVPPSGVGYKTSLEQEISIYETEPVTGLLGPYSYGKKTFFDDKDYKEAARAFDQIVQNRGGVAAAGNSKYLPPAFYFYAVSLVADGVAKFTNDRAGFEDGAGKKEKDNAATLLKVLNLYHAWVNSGLSEEITNSASFKQINGYLVEIDKKFNVSLLSNNSGVKEELKGLLFKDLSDEEKKERPFECEAVEDAWEMVRDKVNKNGKYFDYTEDGYTGQNNNGFWIDGRMCSVVEETPKKVV